MDQVESHDGNQGESQQKSKLQEAGSRRLGNEAMTSVKCSLWNAKCDKNAVAGGIDSRVTLLSVVLVSVWTCELISFFVWYFFVCLFFCLNFLIVR